MLNPEPIGTTKTRKYVQLTLEQKQQIYKDRFKYKQKDMATFYHVKRNQIANIIEQMRKYNQSSKLTDTDIVEIATATTNIKSDVVSKIVEAKAELITLDAKYKSQQIETQNTLHVAITEDIEKSRSTVDKSTSIAMRSLQEAIDRLDHSDSFSVTAIATAYEKIVNAQQKHMNTLLKVGSHYGIVDQTPKTPLVDQSTTNINKQTGITIKIEEMKRNHAIPVDIMSKDNDTVIETEIVK